MTKQFLIIGLLTALAVVFSCNRKTDNKSLQTQNNTEKMIITADTLKQILEAFNRHDLDAIMGFFSDDCSFDFPRGRSDLTTGVQEVRHRGEGHRKFLRN